MKRIFILFSVLALSVSYVQAKELTIDKVSNGDARKWGYLDGQAATKEFAGYTFTYTSYGGSAGRGRQVMGVTGTAVGYFAPNGRIYIWQKEAEKIKIGEWWISSPIRAQKGPGDNLLCFDFKDNNELGKCAILKRLGEELYERTKGNVFKLKAGKVPKTVKSHSRKLQKIADNLGK